MESPRDGEVPHLEEDHPDDEEDEDDVHARDEVGVDDVVADSLLAHGGVSQTPVRLGSKQRQPTPKEAGERGRVRLPGGFAAVLEGYCVPHGGI